MFADGGLLSYSGQIRCLPVKVYPEVYGESAKSLFIVMKEWFTSIVYWYVIKNREKLFLPG